MIYFVQPIDGGPVKIGFTDNLSARLIQLEQHYRVSLAVLATLPGDRAVERSIHKKFAHLRFGQTEQFRPEAELFEFINKPLLVCPNPELVEALEPRATMVGIRGTPEWKGWLEQFADHQRTTIVDLIDWALETFAQESGFERPPKR
jgi:hypothetical protein